MHDVTFRNVTIRAASGPRIHYAILDKAGHVTEEGATDALWPER